jgi:hypothetical protein
VVDIGDQENSSPFGMGSVTLVGIGSEMKTSYAKSVWETISTTLFSVW